MEQTGEKAKNESPTLNNILDGKAQIRMVGENSFLEERVVSGKKWSGKSLQYEVILPHPTKTGENWTTYLTVWNPLPLNYGAYDKIPETQIFISTGEGEMLLTHNRNIINQVLEKINQQAKKE